MSGATPMMTVGAVAGVAVAGTGCAEAVGARRVDNDEVDAVVRANGGRPVPRGWLDGMGLRSRQWTATPGGGPLPGAPTTEDLLTQAAAAALDVAGVAAREVDVLVSATTTPSRLTSSMGTVVGGRLGTTRMAIELRAGCPSALHGIVVAAAQLAAGASVAVITAAETLSRVAPGTGPLAYAAGDGAAAAVLVRTDDTSVGIGGGVLGSDGSLSDLVGVPAQLPPRREDVEGDRFRLGFGPGYDEAAMSRWRSVGAAALDAAGTAPSSVCRLVANQAGRERLAAAATGAGVDPGAVVDLMGTTANSGSASFMAALDAAHRADGTDSPGAGWLLVSVGGGLSYGALVVSP